MDKKKGLYRQLGEWAGWVSVTAFVLGVAAALADQDIILPGNDWWQAAVYLALFGIFANLAAKE